MPVTFSFGENWLKYIDRMPPAAIQTMVEYVRDWLGDVDGLRFLDVGSGSGLTSLVAHELGARVTSFDIDPASVKATELLRERAGSPASWTVSRASILDAPEVGTFDIVVSWGVLHHTGDVWRAIDNTARCVAPGGRLWLALYTKTSASKRSLRTKRLYNRSPDALKRAWRGAYATAKFAKSAARGDLHPVARHRERRGMDWWRDIEDWLGGLPYEPVAPGEVLARLRPLGFELERLADAGGEGRNDVYLFSLPSRPPGQGTTDGVDTGADRPSGAEGA
jgi:2-polyprenyl-6-hydroxyphenyl methylase/3-demethylubiquinone-9 3-methyltransferase